MHPEGGSRNGIGIKHSKVMSPNSIHELGTDLYIVLLPRLPMMVVTLYKKAHLLGKETEEPIFYIYINII